MTARRAFVKPLRKLPIGQPQSREPACAVSLPAPSRKNVDDARRRLRQSKRGKPAIGIYRSAWWRQATSMESQIDKQKPRRDAGARSALW